MVTSFADAKTGNPVEITKLYKVPTGFRSLTRRNPRTLLVVPEKALITALKLACKLLLPALTLLHGSVAAEAHGKVENRPRHAMAPASASEPRPRNDDSRQRNEDSDRRASRLSPEERKALRQQINEAGQDLYPPRRP